MVLEDQHGKGEEVNTHLGVDITFEEHGETTLAVDDLGNNYHFTIIEVNQTGEAIFNQDEKAGTLGYKRLHLEVTGPYVTVLRGVNDNPELNDDEEVEAQVGQHTITIKHTKNEGVRLNGNPATIGKDTESIRHPKRLR